MESLAYVSTIALVLTMGVCAESKRPQHAGEVASPTLNTEPRTRSSGGQTSVPVVHVEDPSGKLSPEDRSALISRLEQLGSESNVQLSVTIVSALNGESIEQLGERTFKAWGLGERAILLLIVIEERQARIETGHGVEKIAPDDVVHAVLVRHLNPHLRAEDFAGGIDETFGVLLALLQPENRPKVVP